MKDGTKESDMEVIGYKNDLIIKESIKYFEVPVTNNATSPVSDLNPT